MDEQLYTVELPPSGRYGYVNCGVVVRGGRVVAAAPIMRRFIGQSIETVERWCWRQGGSCFAHDHKLIQRLLPF